MTEENIKLNNIIFNMQNKNKKMYSSSLIKKLEELLKEKSIDKIVYFLLDNNINLGNICPINYRNLLILNNMFLIIEETCPPSGSTKFIGSFPIPK